MFLFAFTLHAETYGENGTAEDVFEATLGDAIEETPAAAKSGKPETERETRIGIAASSKPEFKFVFSQDFKIPFLYGNHPLLRGNHIKFGLTYEIAPIAMNFIGNVSFSPIALLEFDAGTLIGLGWNLGGIRGIGVNEADLTGQTSIRVDTGNFSSGTFISGYFGGAFQFNLAAVSPGDWKHIIMRSYHRFSVDAFTGADRNDPWFFMNDEGENRNGWRYSASHLIGYVMPKLPVLKMVGFLAESDVYLNELPGGEKWGDTDWRWNLGIVMNFRFTDSLTAVLLPQFRLHRKYDNYVYKPYGDNNEVFFQDRNRIDGRSFGFYRVAMTLTYTL